MERRDFSNEEDLVCTIAELIPYFSDGCNIALNEETREACKEEIENSYKREKAERILCILNDYIDNRIREYLRDFQMIRNTDRDER